MQAKHTIIKAKKLKCALKSSPVNFLPTRGTSGIVQLEFFKFWPVDASQDETLGFESNGGSNHAAFSLNHIRCGGFIGRSH